MVHDSSNVIGIPGILSLPWPSVWHNQMPRAAFLCLSLHRDVGLLPWHSSASERWGNLPICHISSPIACTPIKINQIQLRQLFGDSEK